jgi:hypothetical protein
VQEKIIHVVMPEHHEKTISVLIPDHHYDKDNGELIQKHHEIIPENPYEK